MKYIEDQNRDGSIKWLKEYLSDGSPVYDVTFGNGIIHCKDFGEAEQLFIALTNNEDIGFDNGGFELPPGATLIDHKESSTKGQSIVLCRWPRSQVEFVTWVYMHEDRGCVCGHYFHKIIDAAKDFEERD